MKTPKQVLQDWVSAYNARDLPTGKSFTLQGCGFFHVVEGKIHFQRG
jgi:hypothetical protein